MAAPFLSETRRRRNGMQLLQRDVVKIKRTVSTVGKKRAKQAGRILGPDNGGHHIVGTLIGNGWACTSCRVRSGTKAKLLRQRCTGEPKAWDKTVAATRANDGSNGTGNSAADEGRKHDLRKSGLVLWCAVCGSFAESKAVNLTSKCRDILC